MDARKTMNHAQRNYLRAAYELAERKAKRSIAFLDIRDRLLCCAEEADGACEFWVARGVLEWSALGHVALTYVGLRKAERLEQARWSFATL